MVCTAVKLPRIIIGNAAGWIRLLQRERKENVRLRRELTEWQNKFLQLKGTQPLFTPPVKTEVADRPPVGPLGKQMYLAKRETERNHPTAEQVLGVR
jgi:hypothetical protein